MQQGKDEDRKDFMLRVASEYIRKNCLNGKIIYDDAWCDGNCVAIDCEEASDASYMEEATELEYLSWFRMNADFGPAHSGVIDAMHKLFRKSTDKRVPAGWSDDE